MGKEIVIVGCGAGGGTAAQFARKTDRNSNITVFEKDNFPQYSKCGLPYVISGRIPKVDDLVEFPVEWFEKNRINLFLNTIVKKVDVSRKTVTAENSKGEIVEQPYDSFIIATGASSTVPPINNIQKENGLIPGAFTLRTINDAKQILSFVEKGKKATVVGAGLIGLETADALYKKGMKVTIVEALPNILSCTLDKDMLDPVLERITRNITLFSNHIATGVVSKNGNISQVFIRSNENGEETKISTDLLVVATGVAPDVSLAENAGCVIGETGGIMVNEKSETTVQNIYAVGDCTESRDFVTKKPVSVGLGSIVVRQGIAAGVNAAGGQYHLPQGVLQTCTSEFFGVEIAVVGPATENIHDVSLVSGRFQGSSHPDYFPGGESIMVKVTVNEQNGEILSAQAVGSNAAQRINTFACAILNGMNVEELKKLETAYAPPIAPTLDVITLACDVVSRKLCRR